MWRPWLHAAHWRRDAAAFHMRLGYAVQFQPGSLESRSAMVSNMFLQLALSEEVGLI